MRYLFSVLISRMYFSAPCSGVQENEATRTAADEVALQHDVFWGLSGSKPHLQMSAFAAYHCKLVLWCHLRTWLLAHGKVMGA